MPDSTNTPDGFLISPRELAGRAAPDRPLLIDARTAPAYAQGHLPGAVFLSTYGIFAPDTRPAGLAAFRRETAEQYAAVGVTRDRPVVVYEDEIGMRAAREVWILEYLGHRDVRMLDGGLRAWTAAGGALETTPVRPVPAVFDPQVRDDRVVSIDDVQAGLSSPDRVLLDVRDATEFAGRDDTACCDRRGHVPGAQWLEWTELLDHGRFKSPSAIRALLAARGIAPTVELVPYCHRGARSANAYLALRYAGLPRVRNFIGSFHEWSARKDLPIET